MSKDKNPFDSMGGGRPDYREGEPFDAARQRHEKTEEIQKREKRHADARADQHATGRLARQWEEMGERRREKALKRSIPETIGHSWFWLALLFLLGFPLLDILQKMDFFSGRGPKPSPLWREIFQTNAWVGLLICLPVFLAYALDYWLCRKASQSWEDAKKKQGQMITLAILLAAVALAALVSTLKNI